MGKLTELQAIIGFSRVKEIRGLLKKFAGKYAQDIKAAGFGSNKSRIQSILMECLGRNIVYWHDAIKSRDSRSVINQNSSMLRLNVFATYSGRVHYWQVAVPLSVYEYFKLSL